MNKKEAIVHLESFIADCKEFESVNPTIKDGYALDIAIESLKKDVQEVPVQEQLMDLNKKFKSMYRSLMVFSVTIMIILNLMFYRMINQFQGLNNILKANVDINKNIADILSIICRVLN